MAFSRLLTSPLVFCGIGLANLLIVVVVAAIRSKDALARAMIWPTAALALAVVSRTVMREAETPDLALFAGRMSYMSALLMVPALLGYLTPDGRRRPVVALTMAVAGAAFVDPLLFEGTTVARVDFQGRALLVPELAPHGWWLVPYGLITLAAIVHGVRRLEPEESSWVATVVLCAAVMSMMSVVVVAADLGWSPQLGLEIVASAAASTLLAHHLLSRSAIQVEQLIASTASLEARRRAWSDHARRITRVSALGDAAGQLVARLEGPARQLENEVSVARGEITQACDVGQCDVEAMQAIIDAGAATRKLLRTIRRVRAFASPEVDTSERCHVAASLRRAIAMLDHMARHQTLIRLTTREDPPVIANRDQLTQLFVVLLRAMMRSATDGPSRHPVTVRVGSDDRQVTVQITAVSRGAGGRPTLDPYGDRDAVDDGQGLDMATAARLVHAFGGELRAEGASLIVMLPHAAAREDT